MKLSELKATYIQDADQMDSGEMQIIEVTALPATLHLIEDDKPDYYFTIKTDRFAFDDIDEMVTLLNGFKKMII